MSNHVVRIIWQIWRLWAGKRLSVTLPGSRAVGPGNPESQNLVAFLAAPSCRPSVSPAATAEPHPPARVLPRVSPANVVSMATRAAAHAASLARCKVASL